MRIDEYLTKIMHVPSRSKAQSLIKNKKVLLNNELILKNSIKIDLENDQIKILEEIQYVSRAALKLKHAIDCFKLDPTEKICLDVGSSTGGFCQVLLEAKANEVIGIDVGHDQIDKSLFKYKNFKNFEGVNAKNPLPFKELFDLISIDVSFISVTKILENLIKHLNKTGKILLLVKPQFEYGPNNFKNGVIPIKEHEVILKKLRSFISSINLNIEKEDISPIKGKEGNQEYLWLLSF